MTKRDPKPSPDGECKCLHKGFVNVTCPVHGHLPPMENNEKNLREWEKDFDERFVNTDKIPLYKFGEHIPNEIKHFISQALFQQKKDIVAMVEGMKDIRDIPSYGEYIAFANKEERIAQSMYNQALSDIINKLSA